MPQTCTGCKSHLAVWCRCYSAKTIALGLCVTCLRSRGGKKCWNCKTAARRTEIVYGGCCRRCGNSRRCSECDFFEYAPDHPIPGSVCPRCQVPFITPTVQAVASTEGDVRSRDRRYIKTSPADPRCLSCLHLDRHDSRRRKMHGASTWCQTCTKAHTCNVCKKITKEVDKVPFCSTCTKIKIAPEKNFAQWTCDSCRPDGAPPLTLCTVCARAAQASLLVRAKKAWIWINYTAEKAIKEPCEDFFKRKTTEGIRGFSELLDSLPDAAKYIVLPFKHSKGLKINDLSGRVYVHAAGPQPPVGRQKRQKTDNTTL